jgi:hypothetical protein
MASLAVRNGIATSTGPKISSATTRELVLTPVIRVGGKKQPVSGQETWSQYYDF